jgi:hypothetical protein
LIVSIAAHDEDPGRSAWPALHTNGFTEDNAIGRAARLARYFLLALFPATLCMIEPFGRR